MQRAELAGKIQQTNDKLVSLNIRDDFQQAQPDPEDQLVTSGTRRLAPPIPTSSSGGIQRWSNEAERLEDQAAPDGSV